MSIFKRLKLKNVSNQTIVITGASSGIGLATALSAGRSGAKVVLVSRNEATLAETKRKIENFGGEAVYIMADVADRTAVKNVVRFAEKSYGGFDTWVNCAGVSVMGLLEEVSDEDSRRLFETNYWGTVYGSLAAAEHLKNKGGAIINLGSLLSDISIPLQGMYCASKHAVKGFTESLRVELDAEQSNISVTLVKPAAIATPFFAHAKNYTQLEAKAPPPVYAPEEVAYAILKAAEKPIRDIRVGGAGVFMAALGAHAPQLSDWLNSTFMIDAQTGSDLKSRHKNNLHQSGNDGFVRGQNMGHPISSVYTRAVLNPAVTATALAVAGAAVFAIFSSRSRMKVGGSVLSTGLNLLQNTLITGALAKSIERQAEKTLRTVGSSLKDNAQSVNRAVNENSTVIKKKALSFLK